MTFVAKILGSNSAIPAHDRHQSSQLLTIGSTPVLVDCGECTQLQLSRYGVKSSRIKHIFISHLHGDHYLGLMGLLSTMHLYGRSTPISIHAPEALQSILELHFKASQTSLSYKLNFVPVAVERKRVVLEESSFTVEAFPLQHGIECYGYLFRETPHKRNMIKEKIPTEMRIQDIVRLKDGETIYDETGRVLYSPEAYTYPPEPQKSYAYCSDTAYDERLAEILQGVDCLYHEATFAGDMAARAGETMHSTAAQAAQLAEKARAGMLIIGHFSTRYKELDIFLEDARQIFPNTHLAVEGSEYNIGEQP